MASEHDELTAQDRRVRELEGGVVAPDTTVLVFCTGDDDLLQLEGRRAWHFPRAAEVGYAGYYPAYAAAAIADLEALRAEGADHLVLPRTAIADCDEGGSTGSFPLRLASSCLVKNWQLEKAECVGQAD
jgi:predicted aminopeptidase